MAQYRVTHRTKRLLNSEHTKNIFTSGFSLSGVWKHSDTPAIIRKLKLPSLDSTNYINWNNSLYRSVNDCFILFLVTALAYLFCRYLLSAVYQALDIAVNRNDKNTCHQGVDILIDNLMKAKDLCLRKMQSIQNAVVLKIHLPSCMSSVSSCCWSFKF